MTPEMLDALVGAGATAEMIAAAWKAEMTDRGSTASERRAKDAERKRIARSRPQCPTESDGQDGTEADNADIGNGSPLDKERSPRPPKEIKPLSTLPQIAGEMEKTEPAERPKPAKRERRPEGYRLPADWMPIRFADSTTARGVADRRGREWYKSELENFRAHWASSAERNAYKLDWQAAWIKWVIKSDKEGSGNGNGRAGGKSGAGKVDGFKLAIDEVIAFGEAQRGHADDD